YATEAARGLLGRVFGRFGRSPICSQTSEAEWRSWRAPERLGMEPMARLDYDDPLYPPEENPTMVHRPTRDAWERRAGWAARRARLDYDDPRDPPEESPTKVYRLTRDEWERRAG